MANNNNNFTCGDVLGLFEDVQYRNITDIWVDMRHIGNTGAIVELTPKENGKILAVKAEKFRVTIERIED
jgi:hypothetical protein